MAINYDPYVYPNSSVLRNKHDIKDKDILHTVEEALSGSRAQELQQKPLPTIFDFDHLKKIVLVNQNRTLLVEDFQTRLVIDHYSMSVDALNYNTLYRRLHLAS